MKIVLVSDNHGNLKVIKDIATKHQDGDYYLHCGDSELNPALLRPFVSVKGNNDYTDLPDHRIIKILNHQILLMHGHRYVSFRNYDLLIKRAKELNCDVVFFGHTHMFLDACIDNIRLINPGSCSYNRDMTMPSYAIVDINDKEIRVKRYNL